MLSSGARATRGGPGELDAYFRDIGPFEKLSRKDEAELGRRIQQGDDEALETLVRSNLRFVVLMARRFAHQGVPLADLVQEGNVALMEAGRRFDPERGTKFITYAVWWIRQAMQQAVAQLGKPVRIPVVRSIKLKQLMVERERLSARLGRVPTMDEMAEAVGAPAAHIKHLLRLSQAELRLDEPVSRDEGGDSVGGVFEDEMSEGPDRTAERRMVEEGVRNAIDALDERDALVLTRYHGIGGDEPCTLDVIAEELGVSRERVRQIRNRAYERLRATPAAGKLGLARRGAT